MRTRRQTPKSCPHVFVMKGWVVVALNTKNASRRMHFACLCEPGLEGMCQVDGEDRKHAHGGVFSVLAVRGGEEDTEQPKHAKGHTFWLFGGRGRVKKTPNTKNAPTRARFSCIRKRPFIPGIHLGGPGAFQAIKAIQSIPGCFQSSQSNLGNTLNALAILSKAVKAI